MNSTHESANLQLAERAYEALLADDLDAFLALCASEVVLVYPGDGAIRYGGHFQGADGIRHWSDLHDEAEEILAFDIQHMMSSGGFVFVVGRFEGRALETDQRWGTRFVHVLTIEAGVLVRFEAFFDTAVAFEAHGGPPPRMSVDP